MDSPRRETKPSPPTLVEPSENNYIKEIEEDHAIVTTPSGGKKCPHESDNSDSDKEIDPAFENISSPTLDLKTPTLDG